MGPAGYLPHNLRAEEYPLVGRARESLHLHERLRARSTLLVLMGMPGVGKTKLVHTFATRVAHNEHPMEPLGFHSVIWIACRGRRDLTMDHDIIPAIEVVRRAHPASSVEWREWLATTPTLFIFDDLPEEGNNEVWQFLSTLASTPGSPKHRALITMVTGAKPRLYVRSPISLLPLADDVVTRIMANWLGVRADQDDLGNLGDSGEPAHQFAPASAGAIDPMTLRRLAALSLGNPRVALLISGYVLGQDARQALEVAQALRGADARKFFLAHVEKLKEAAPLAYRALLALSLFRVEYGATESAIADVIGLPVERMDELRACLQALRLRTLIRDGRPTPSPGRLGTRTTPLRYYMQDLVNEYVCEYARHGEAKALLDSMRERWISFYLGLTADHGGLDWSEWDEPYNIIDEEWPNLTNVFRYCDAKAHPALHQLWDKDHLLGFANILGHWHSRMEWLRRIVDHCAKGDRGFSSRVHAEALAALAYTLVQYGTHAFLTEAREAIADVASFAGRYPWAECEATTTKIALELHNGDDTLAEQGLARFVGLVRLGTWDEDTQRRWHIDELYHRGLIALHRAKLGAPGHFALAKACFTWMWHQGETGRRYSRASIFALTHLAEIAIEEDNLDGAYSYFATIAAIPEHKRDVSRYCRIQCAYAKYWEKRGEFPQALTFAIQARDGFEKLGIDPEWREMQEMTARLTQALDAMPGI